MARNGVNDYGTSATRSSKVHRPAILANHILHWISALIVMSIAAYFISAFPHNTHIVYWVSIAAIDTVLYIPLLALPASNKYKGYLWPISWIFSYLWLTAFIFAAQDYNSSPGSWAYSPSSVSKPALKKTLEAFAFIAFFTNLVGAALEGRLHDVQRFKTAHNVHDEKHTAGHTADGVQATQPVV